VKLSDYVVEFLSNHVKHIFMVSGGGAMHLNDSVGIKGMDVPMMHEQAAAIAAEAYSRINGMGVCLVTTGPGGTNAITGVAGAWLESTPMMVISGQVKRADMINERGVRQYGIQELDIVTIVKSITKYAVTVREPEKIRFHLERAMYEATTGRRGPVWLDIPLDVQSAQVNPEKMIPFSKEEEERPTLKVEVTETIRLLNEAKRPVLLIGNGARTKNIHAFAELLNIPVLSTWGAMDILTHWSFKYFGCPGAVAARGPNFILQNADLVLVIGARLDQTITGYDKEQFCPRAVKIIVDVDKAELEKTPNAMLIHSDAEIFMQKVLLNHWGLHKSTREEWFEYCEMVFEKFHLSYKWVKRVEFSDVIVAGSSGVTLDELWLSVVLKAGQRMFSTMGLGAMGFGIPAAIGACLASGKPVTCIDGDGSFQLNIQELDTVRRLKLPIKFYYLNNGGYRSIQLTQDRFFDGRHVGSEFKFVDINKIAKIYGVDITEIKTGNEERPPRYDSMLTDDGVQTAMPLYDMAPHLSDLERWMYEGSN
jgi:acetolactate synthase I/II/III large subunit